MYLINNVHVLSKLTVIQLNLKSHFLLFGLRLTLCYVLSSLKDNNKIHVKNQAILNTQMLAVNFEDALVSFLFLT